MHSAAPWRREHVEHVVVQPRRVAQLDRPAEVARRDGEELVEPLRRCASSAAAAAPGSARGAGRGARTRSRWLGSHDAASRSFMRCEPNCAELHRVHEARRRLRRPLLDGRRRRQPVEGVVDLDGVEQRRRSARTTRAAAGRPGRRRRASPGTPSPSSRPAHARRRTRSRQPRLAPFGQLDDHHRHVVGLLVDRAAAGPTSHASARGTSARDRRPRRVHRGPR